jgi:hypothetical protein
MNFLPWLTTSTQRGPVRRPLFFSGERLLLVAAEINRPAVYLLGPRASRLLLLFGRAKTAGCLPSITVFDPPVPAPSV